MPRSAAQNEKLRNESRRLLIEAATKVFMATGFAAARMSDIAREAGLSHGLAYHYFPNKDAVFLAVVEATMGRASQMAREALSGREPAIARLRHLCERMLQGAKDHPTYSMILLQASSRAAIPADAHIVLQRSSRQLAAAFAKLIRQAQQAGDLAGGDPNMLARALLATLSGLAMSIDARPNAGSFPPVDVVMRILGPK